MDVWLSAILVVPGSEIIMLPEIDRRKISGVLEYRVPLKSMEPPITTLIASTNRYDCGSD
jgi:hypothetical protein